MPSYPTKPTGCVCKGPGYCQRHNVNKTARWYELCRTDVTYWKLWEAGRGPGQYMTRGPRLDISPVFDRYPLVAHISRRNLLYHVYPSRASTAWRANIQQLLWRMWVFTGRKVIAVALDDTTESLHQVQKLFAAHPDIEWLTFPNDPQLREVATFLPLLRSVASTNPVEATFYAHTKGTTRLTEQRAVMYWRNAMYHHLLDHAWACLDLLMNHPCVGTHKKIYPLRESPFPTGLIHGPWMYCGTFFWFRHSDVYAHPRWEEVPQDRYGAEAWLGGLFDSRQAATVFQPWEAQEHPAISPYIEDIYKWPISDPA